MMRLPLCPWSTLGNLALSAICVSVAPLAGQKLPPVRPGIVETRAGFLVKAELRDGTIITFPAVPNQPQDVPYNGPVGANKGKKLLVLHFELRLLQCVRLDREILEVREKAGGEVEEGSQEYRYGGWWVENAKYSLCGRPALAQPVVGPWINAFWDPLDIQPKAGEIDLVYGIDPAAKNLVFTDGRVSTDVDALLKRH